MLEDSLISVIWVREMVVKIGYNMVLDGSQVGLRVYEFAFSTCQELDPTLLSNIDTVYNIHFPSSEKILLTVKTFSLCNFPFIAIKQSLRDCLVRTIGSNGSFGER